MSDFGILLLIPKKNCMDDKLEGIFDVTIGFKKPVLSQKIFINQENLKIFLGLDEELELSSVVGIKVDSEFSTVSMVLYKLDKPEKMFLDSIFGSTPARFVRDIIKLRCCEENEEERRKVVKLWHCVLSWLISHKRNEMPTNLKKLNENIGAKLPIPPRRKLLFYMNPFSGTGNAQYLVDSIARPVIERDAGCEIVVIRTERKDHALEHIQRIELQHLELFDGVVIISGDGLFYEVLQGVMERPDWAHVMRMLPFGILPAGSGNGLATTLLKKVHPTMVVGNGFNNCVLLALNRTQRLDVLAVDLIKKSPLPADLESGANQVRRVYSFLSLEWAAQSWIDIASEKARWLGSTRFVIWAVRSVLLGKRYSAELSFLPACQDPDARTAQHPSVPKVSQYWSSHTESETRPVTQLLPNPLGPVPENWVKIKSDKFLTMWNVNVPWLATDACVSPDSKLGDGYVQILYVDGGRLDLLKHLLSLSEMTATNIKNVKTFPTRAYRLEPLDADKDLGVQKYLCIDGEVVEYTALQLENLCQLMTIYAFDS